MSNTPIVMFLLSSLNHHALTRRTLTHYEVCPPLVDDSSLSTTETIAQSVATCRRCAGTLFQRFYNNYFSKSSLSFFSFSM